MSLLAAYAGMGLVIFALVNVGVLAHRRRRTRRGRRMGYIVGTHRE